jgi:hypothetical protein
MLVCWGRRAALLAGVAVLTIAPSGALASSGDVAATSTYIRINHKLVQEAVSRIPAVHTTLRRVLAQVRSECPMVAAGSPQNSESEQLSNEVVGVMVTAAVHGALPFPHEYLSVAGRLKWSNPTVTSGVRAYVAKVRVLESLKQPDICADIRSWSASGFQTLAPSTLAFAPRFMAAWVSPGELPMALSAYETADETRLLRETHSLEAQFSEFEAREVETWGQFMNTLGLWP